MEEFMLAISALFWRSLNSNPCYVQWRGYGDGGWFGPGMMGWGMWDMGWIFILIFWALVIAALIFLIRWLAGLSRSRPSSEKPHDSALEILKQRYAKGEIDKEEFDQKKRDLMGG